MSKFEKQNKTKMHTLFNILKFLAFVSNKANHNMVKLCIHPAGTCVNRLSAYCCENKWKKHL